MEREIYEPAVAAYAEDVRIFVLNYDTGELELYQTQKLMSMDNTEIMNAVRGGANLIIGIYANLWTSENRTFDDIRLVHLDIDPINVVRVAYTDPDRIQIQGGKLEPVVITYGVIQMPNYIGLDTTVTDRLFEGG